MGKRWKENERASCQMISKLDLWSVWGTIDFFKLKSAIPIEHYCPSLRCFLFLSHSHEPYRGESLVWQVQTLTKIRSWALMGYSVCLILREIPSFIWNVWWPEGKWCLLATWGIRFNECPNIWCWLLDKCSVQLNKHSWTTSAWHCIRCTRGKGMAVVSDSLWSSEGSSWVGR